MECKCGYEKGENPNCSYCKQFAEEATLCNDKTHIDCDILGHNI
ncbi:hypothetical protein LCGC14_2490490 [marine sediment metagenome]|uniref:Uncharacterized protein n=1 Tax=marine sediment metagenome TaxID=412755 RepID=A0A0F9B4Y9_9ZZZZ